MAKEFKPYERSSQTPDCASSHFKFPAKPRRCNSSAFSAWQLRTRPTRAQEHTSKTDTDRSCLPIKGTQRRRRGGVFTINDWVGRGLTCWKKRMATKTKRCQAKERYCLAKVLFHTAGFSAMHTTSATRGTHTPLSHLEQDVLGPRAPEFHEMAVRRGPENRYCYTVFATR